MTVEDPQYVNVTVSGYWWCYIIQMLLWVPLLLLFQCDNGGPSVCKRDSQCVLVGVTSFGCSCGYRYYYYFRVTVEDPQYVNVAISGIWLE